MLLRPMVSVQLVAKGFCSRAEPLVLRQQVDSHIRRLVLNDPKRRNALSLSMLESIKEELKAAVEDKDLRAIILSQGSSPVFSSGHDLKELTTKAGLAHHAKIFAECTSVMKLVQDIQIPVIAQVKGLAAAAGCQLVASCDIVVAADTAKFSTPGINFGLFCATPGVAVSRAVPRKVAMDMLLTGEAIDAQTALRSGLVSRIVPEAQLEEETLKVARKISHLSKTVVSLGKLFFYGQVEHERNSAYKLAERAMLENLRLKDCQEGLDSFAQKRKPQWTHSTDKSH